MVGVRASAAGLLLYGNHDSSVDEVLDFLESIALFFNRGVLDEEITWHAFYWSMANYWQSAQEHIRRVQADEGYETWKDLADAVSRLRAFDARRSGKSAPTGEQTLKFLQDETTLPAAPTAGLKPPSPLGRLTAKVDHANVCRVTPRRYAVVIEKAGSNFSAYVPDLPGCVATGATIEEAEREISRAIRFHLDGLCEDGAPILQPSAVCEYVEA